MMNFLSKTIVLLLILSLTIISCQKKNEEKGEITLTFITNRTDLAPKILPQYAEIFKKTHPEIKEIIFESSQDYDNTLNTRMNTKLYGDILVIPNFVKHEEIPNYFEALGTIEDLSKTYKEINRIVDGKVYGIPIEINVSGTIIYNVDAFKKVGIDKFPSTPIELYDAAKKLKAQGIIPLYTNYSAKWPFNQWNEAALLMAGDKQYAVSMIYDKTPFAKDKPYYELYKIMYDFSANKWIEDDPSTSDWDSSKQMLADGKIGMMVLGSWAYPQITALTDKKDSIGLAAFPVKAPDGNNYLSQAAGNSLAVNKYSKNKDLAKEFLEFIIKDSGYIQEYGVISPDINAKNPKFVEDLLNSVNGKTLTSQWRYTGEEEAKLKEIEWKTGIDLIYGAEYKQEIIDAGLKGLSFDDIMNKMNEKWAKEVIEKTE